MNDIRKKLTRKRSGILDECIFSTVRSSGPGGQNVNKVSSKVELRFNIPQSHMLNDKEKSMIMDKLRTRINKEGELIIRSQSERTQYQNKIRVTEKLFTLLQQALVSYKKRIPSTPTQASKQKRFENKRRQSEKKKLRGTPEMDE